MSSDFRWVFTPAWERTVNGISGLEWALIKWKSNGLSLRNTGKKLIVQNLFKSVYNHGRNVLL